MNWVVILLYSLLLVANRILNRSQYILLLGLIVLHGSHAPLQLVPHEDDKCMTYLFFHAKASQHPGYFLEGLESEVVQSQPFLQLSELSSNRGGRQQEVERRIMR